MEYYFFAVSFMSLVAVTSSLINLPECESCSGRADVPCKIRKMQHPCHHSEYHEYWPGKPRDLEATRKKIGENKWMANFTWNPPYDASISSLNGFFLTVNMVAHLKTIIYIGPLCFYANLSGTNWTSLPKNERHAVTFHFDCITAEVKTEIHLFLMSSPKPDHNAEHTDIMLEIGDMPPMEQEATLRINESVIVEDGQSKVEVWFGPVEPGIAYHMVCLSPEKTHYAYCEQNVNITAPQQEYVFNNVPPGYYKIMVKRSGKSSYYVTAKFFVPVPPPVTTPKPQPNLDSIQIAVIIVGCILVLIMTTGTYCVLKKYHVIKYCDVIRSCVFFNSYQPTEQTQPNNNNDQVPVMKKKVVMIFYPESKAFIKAVEDLSDLVGRWGDCDVTANQNMLTDGLELQQKLNECCDGQFVCIILSEHINVIYDILKHGEDLPNDSDLQTQFIFELLKKIHSEGKQKTIVSFFPVQLENLLLKEEKVLQLTETAGTRLEACKANLKHIYQLLYKIHDNQFSSAVFQDSLNGGNEQMKELLESIQKLPRGIITGDKLDNSNIQVTTSQQGPTVSHCEPENLSSHLPSKLCEKHLETLKWTEEQNRLKNGHTQVKWTPDFSTQTFPKVMFEPVRNTDSDLTCTCDRSCDDNDALYSGAYSRLHEEATKGNICFADEKSRKTAVYRPFKNSDSHFRVQDNFENQNDRNGFCRPGKISSRSSKPFRGLGDDSVYPKPDGMPEESGEFLAPDSDSESDTASMLFENINRRYFENMKHQQISEL